MYGVWGCVDGTTCSQYAVGVCVGFPQTHLSLNPHAAPYGARVVSSSSSSSSARACVRAASAEGGHRWQRHGSISFSAGECMFAAAAAAAGAWGGRVAAARCCVRRKRCRGKRRTADQRTCRFAAVGFLARRCSHAVRSLGRLPLARRPLPASGRLTRACRGRATEPTRPGSTGAIKQGKGSRADELGGSHRGGMSIKAPSESLAGRAYTVGCVGLRATGPGMGGPRGSGDVP